jgi:predicted deacylase
MPEPSLITQTIHGHAPGPKFLISAGVHGDEWEPMAAVRLLMQTIQPDALKGTLTLVPVVNAAAYGRGERTAAEDNLDLARTCPGDPAGSVTQRTAHALSELIRAADYYIDLHTGGKLFTLIPLAGYTLHKNPAVLDAQRKMAHAFNLPFIWGTTPNLDGRSLSVARDANVPAIYVEHGGGTQFDLAAVRDLVNGCLNVMADVGMIDFPRPASNILTLVEDPRENSGHLQINYPSPLDGIFEPAAIPGQWMEKGESIGRVTDPLTGHAVDIPAEQSGLLVMLRAAPRVPKNEALAAIVAAPKGPSHVR